MKWDYKRVLLSLIIELVGLYVIFLSPKLSYNYTKDYFLPGGSGSYDMNHYNWMLNSYFIALLFIGTIICILGIVNWLNKD